MDMRLTRPQRDAILLRMQQLRFSQQKLGLLMGGVPQATVSGILRGERRITAEEVAVIGAALGLPEIQDAAGIPPEQLAEALWDVIARVIITHLRDIVAHDREELLFGIVLILESKRPHGESPYTRLLRQLSGMVHSPAPARRRPPHQARTTCAPDAAALNAIEMPQPQLV